MSVLFTGCLHLGHRAIAKYRPFVGSCQENTDLICDEWNDVIKKNDVVYVLGDAAFDKNHLDLMGKLPGRKILVKGNHDTFVTAKEQLEVFEEIHGMVKYKGIWLTHCPMHPNELWNKPNLHAHVHSNTVMINGTLDKRYLNVCADNLYTTWDKKIFITLEEVREYFKDTKF